MSFNKPIKPATDIEAVRRSAFWHLGRRDHSEQELRTKLARKTTNQSWIDTVIHQCYEYNYLNDQRFIDSFIRTAQNKGYGIARIKRDLQQKGISSEDAQRALQQSDYDYIASALTLLERKYSQHIANQRLKQKAMAFLQNKGHSFDHIFAAIEQHNSLFPIEECDLVSEAAVLLSGKFKSAIQERKLHDKAIRFLLNKGYNYADINQAISLHNNQLDS